MGHVTEALDRTDSIPLLVPSIHMYRKPGRTITKDQLTAARVASPADAQEWRAKTRQFFQESDPAREAESTGKLRKHLATIPKI